MHILVDGHNLIGQIPHLSLDMPDDEMQLVMLLRRYATRKRGRRVVVVFDGGGYGYTGTMNGYGVECHFARKPDDADKELIRRIRAIKRPGAWQVVSSDRAVAGEARARKIAVVSSAEFGRRLLMPNESPQDAPAAKDRGKEKDIEKHKDRTLTPREIEEWLRLFGAEDELDDSSAYNEE